MINLSLDVKSQIRQVLFDETKVYTYDPVKLLVPPRIY